MTGAMEKFFAPRGVAVIGASATPGKPGNVLLRNLDANGYAGGVYPVNPRGGEIEGRKVYRSIEELPDGVDQAVVTLPAADNPGVVRACAAKGIEAIVLAASGFAEIDRMGESLQDELARAIAETGVRVLGPNTTGHVSTPSGFTSSFFPLGRIPRGRISYIAQTGNFSGITLRHIMSAENFGVCRVAGLGNKVDVDESELLEYLGDDDETAAILLYLESIKRPRRFLAVAGEVTRRKPVILLKGGRSDAGAQAALAHTASLASDARIVDGAMRQAGVVRIDKYSHLVQVAKALACAALPRGPRVSFLSPSGAFTVCMTDLCRAQGLEVPALEARTRKRLQEISPPFIRMRNPVDIYGAVSLHGFEFAYGEALRAVLADRNVDAAVAIVLVTDETGAPSYDFLVEIARETPDKPVLVTFMGQHERNLEAKAFLEPRGVPAYMLVEEPFEALGALACCRAAMDRGGRRRRTGEGAT